MSFVNIRYIESTYLDGLIDDKEEGAKLIDKMKAVNEDPKEKKVMEYGFDALFMSNEKENQEEQEQEGKRIILDKK